MTDNWRITVDRERCIGSSICAGVASGHFRLVDGRSEVVAETVPADEYVRDAAEMCPMEAITVRMSGTEEQVAPLG